VADRAVSLPEVVQRPEPPWDMPASGFFLSLAVPAGTAPAGEGSPMKSHTEYLTFTIPTRLAFVNITPQVEEAVRKSGVQEGLVLVNAMHITASVFINDDEAGLHADYARWLEGLAPFDPSPTRYAHNRTGEDNADAHMKRQIMGREVVVAITRGKLDFGPWEQIFYGEFDGNRPKRVLVKVIGE
jgi:secondary thiamine-phosphate synthase enzyme